MHQPFLPKSIDESIRLDSGDLRNQDKHQLFVDHEFDEQEFPHLLCRFRRLTFEPSVL